jgi:hypothetical protein
VVSFSCVGRLACIAHRLDSSLVGRRPASIPLLGQQALEKTVLGGDPARPDGPVNADTGTSIRFVNRLTHHAVTPCVGRRERRDEARPRGLSRALHQMVFLQMARGVISWTSLRR